MMLVRAPGVAAILGFMAQPALAQAVPQQDQEFAQEAAEGGLMEVQLGQLAQQQAKDEQVAEFGHGPGPRAGERELIAITEQKAIQLPQELSHDAQQKLTRCSSFRAPISTSLHG